MGFPSTRSILVRRSETSVIWRIKLVLVGLAILACGYAGTIAYDIFFGGPPLMLHD